MSAKATRILFTCCAVLFGGICTIGAFRLLGDGPNGSLFQFLAWAVITGGWTFGCMLVRALNSPMQYVEHATPPPAPS